MNSDKDGLDIQINYRLATHLAESEMRYRLLVESLREVIFQLEPDGRITFVNAAWERLSGYPSVST